MSHLLPVSMQRPQLLQWERKNGVMLTSPTALTHNGGGDSQTIANMVKHAVSKYGGDPDKVFVTGTSSGAMMTQVMAGAYPDVFKAASAYSGVPDGCFFVQGATATQDPPGWNNQCANGQVTKTAAQWGDATRSYYPGYNGTRPRMLMYVLSFVSPVVLCVVTNFDYSWHGTADNTLRYANCKSLRYCQRAAHDKVLIHYTDQESLKQWSNVLGLTTSKTASNTPQSGYTQTIYGAGDSNTAQLVGYSGQGVGHSVPAHESNDIAFFGI